MCCHPLPRNACNVLATVKYVMNNYYVFNVILILWHQPIKQSVLDVSMVVRSVVTHPPVILVSQNIFLVVVVVVKHAVFVPRVALSVLIQLVEVDIAVRTALILTMLKVVFVLHVIPHVKIVLIIYFAKAVSIVTIYRLHNVYLARQQGVLLVQAIHALSVRILFI
eukprot:GHVR01021460.1.p1 GENE.GHVR01021460.1~~GHVR01021460.1.p1  ORF type:complete len:166 (+),score=4.70 GHVR01021460.1:235-732(+)